MRLLLVEDDADLAESLKKDLGRAGYTTDVADNGVDAEFLGDENLYDAIILDLGLPKRSGLEVLANWRKGKNAVPVIILTARDAWHERVDGFKAGADDYLGKPFHVEELLARLNALIHRSNQKPGGVLEVAGIQLDEQQQCALMTHSGETVRLTGTEFKLLRYFLLHPDQILSKSRLIERVYDFDSEKESNVIEAYIKRLRQKLGKKIIQTRRGQGYVFTKSS